MLFRSIYRGTIASSPNRLDLDKHHAIEAGRVFPVCGNTFRMLQQSRFAPHFSFIGDFERHYGLFEGCGSAIPFDRSSGDSASDCGSPSTGTATSGGGSCC